jgi:hypothetical protein
VSKGRDVRIERLTLRVGGIGTGGAALLARLVAEGLAEADLAWALPRRRALHLEVSAAEATEPRPLTDRIVATILAELAREAW